MIVYRIEKNGWGAFCRDSNDLHPPYSDDTLYAEEYCSLTDAKCNREYRFGCDSIDGLIDYFGGDFAHCLAKGGEIVAYKVHKAHVKFGSNGLEVAFKINKAERIN